MVTLGPPTVCGPVLESSPLVRVEAVLAGAEVVVTDKNGNEHARGTAGLLGYADLPVDRPFVHGTTLVAVQRLGADTSEPSVHGTPVVRRPDLMPLPVFGCVLTRCSGNVLLRGLVPGAEVRLIRNGALAGEAVAARRDQWVPLTVTLNGGDVLRATQSLDGVTSPVAVSEPAMDTNLEADVPTPQVLAPLHACETSIMFGSLIPTADLVIEASDGSWVSWLAPSISFTGRMDRRLVEGPLVVRQTLPNCRNVSAETTVEVGPERKPEPPTVDAFCPETRRVRVSNLEAGAYLVFTTREWSSGGPGPAQPLMVTTARGGPQDFDLPTTVGGTGPLMAIAVTQQRCTLTSEPGQAYEYSRPFSGLVPSPAGRIVQPVYACSRTVVLNPSGAGIGRLISRLTGEPLCDDFLPAPPGPFAVETWFPLADGDEVIAVFAGCGADGEDRASVQSVPDPMPNLAIVPPMPTEQSLTVEKAIIGAWVVATVDGDVVAKAPVTSPDGRVSLPLPAPLRERQGVWAYQRMCGASGNVEGFVPVRRGKLSATATPDTAVAERKTATRVDAVRLETGKPVLGRQWGFGSDLVGLTGMASYGWTAPSTPGPMTGWVDGGAMYEQGAFTVTVKPKPSSPPPPDATQVRIVLTSPAGPFSDVKILSITWQLRPMWAGGATADASGENVTVGVGQPPTDAPDKRIAFWVTDAVVTYKGVLGFVHPVPSLLLLKQWSASTMRFDALMAPDGWQQVYDKDGTYLGDAYRMVITGATSP